MSLERAGKWFVTATCDISEDGTLKTEWDFYLTLGPSGPVIEIGASRTYFRKTNRGPWRESGDALLQVDRSTKVMLIEAATTVLAREAEVSYLKDRREEEAAKVRSMMNKPLDGKPS
jgi:hypothetical protein